MPGTDKKSVESFENEITQLKNKIKELEKLPIAKGKIYKFLTAILGTEVSDQVLVNIEFNEDKDDNLLTIIGRPPVLGSSGKQMRHVTPYSFVTHIIKSKIDNSESRIDTLKGLKEPLKIFASEQRGLCLTELDYQRLKDTINSVSDFYYIKMSTIKNAKKKVYYLINEEQIPKKYDIFDENQKIEYQKGYTAKLQKFISHTMDNLQDVIQDENTLSITCEALARFILTLFNQRLYTAFPEEGNTLNYEIRVYTKINDAKAPKNKICDVLTHAEINDKLNSRAELDGKIRIVNNEGAVVKKVIKALETIDSIIEHYNAISENDDDIDCYISEYKKYDSKLKVHGSTSPVVNKLEKYNQAFTKSELKSLCHYHIAKQLYFVFDLKPLEKEVFVSAQKSYSNVSPRITVFPSADGNKSAEYCIKNGKEYRDDSINDAKGYNKDVIFRSEIEKNLRPLLIKKTLDHVYISVMSFFEFREGFSSNESYPISILEAFSKLVAYDYSIPPDPFVKEVKGMCNDIKIFQDNVDTSFTTDSEVEAIALPSYDDSFGLL